MGDDMVKQILGNYTLEEVTWLCSLTESELDMLINLKMPVLHRAKVLGREELADKFDIKMLRALALVLMEYVKEKLENLSHDSGLSKSAASVDSCNLLKCNLGDILSIEELKACIEIEERKKPAKRNSKKDLALALALHNRYLKLSSSWMAESSTASKINDSLVVYYDGSESINGNPSHVTYGLRQCLDAVLAFNLRMNLGQPKLHLCDAAHVGSGIKFVFDGKHHKRLML